MMCFWGTPGMSGAGGFGVGGDGDGVDEAEVDDVAGEDRGRSSRGGREDVGFGEHWLMIAKAVVLRTMPTSQNRDVGHPAPGQAVDDCQGWDAEMGHLRNTPCGSRQLAVRSECNRMLKS